MASWSFRSVVAESVLPSPSPICSGPGLASKERHGAAQVLLSHSPAHALHLLHHLPELRVLLEQPVHVLHGRAAPTSDPQPPLAVDDRRRPPLTRRHGADDRLESTEIPRLGVELGL